MVSCTLLRCVIDRLTLERVMNFICRLHGGSHHLSPVSVVDAAD